MDRVELTIDMVPDMVLDGPVASTPVGWIAMGPGGTLDDAAFAAMEARSPSMAGCGARIERRRWLSAASR